MGKRKNGEGTIYQRSDGLWIYDLTLGYDKNKKRIRKTLANKNLDVLKKKVNETRYLMDRELIAPPNNIKVGEWVSFWLKNYKKISVKQSTYNMYYESNERYILPQLGHYKLTTLNNITIQNFINRLSVEGLNAKNGLSPSSIKKIFITLKQAYNQAIELGMLHKNPCTGVKLPRQNKSRALAFTQEEQKKFLSFCSGETMYTNLFIFAFYTGMRIGEILGITWEDIDWDKKTVTVNKNIVETADHDENAEKKTKIILNSTKTESGTRIIPLNKQALNALKRQKKFSQINFIFSSAAGTPPLRRNILRAFNSILKKAEITSAVTPHSMRHSFATRLLEQGADIKTISELLGHKSIQITLDIYIHVSQDQKRSIVDMLK